jgi:hypothetical protein
VSPAAVRLVPAQTWQGRSEPRPGADVLRMRADHTHKQIRHVATQHGTLQQRSSSQSNTTRCNTTQHVASATRRNATRCDTQSRRTARHPQRCTRQRPTRYPMRRGRQRLHACTSGNPRAARATRRGAAARAPRGATLPHGIRSAPRRVGYRGTQWMRWSPMECCGVCVWDTVPSTATSQQKALGSCRVGYHVECGSKH